MLIFNLFTACSICVSAWTLVAISCERYYAICHPLRSRAWQTLKHAYKLITLIWIASLMITFPIAVYSQLMPAGKGKFIILYVYPLGTTTKLIGCTVRLMYVHIRFHCFDFHQSVFIKLSFPLFTSDYFQPCLDDINIRTQYVAP